MEYKDSLTDVLFIGLCRKAYGALAGWQSERDWWNGAETYQGMVEVSRALMKARNLVFTFFTLPLFRDVLLPSSKLLSLQAFLKFRIGFACFFRTPNGALK